MFPFFGFLIFIEGISSRIVTFTDDIYSRAVSLDMWIWVKYLSKYPALLIAGGGADGFS